MINQVFNRRTLLGLLVLVIFAAYFSLNLSKFRPLLDLNYWLLILIAVLNVAIIVANGFFTRFIVEPFGKIVPLLECLYISLISSIGNYFAPAGTGFIFRAVYLKRNHQLPYNDYISLLFGNYLIVLLVNSIFGLVALELIGWHRGYQYLSLLIGFGAILVLSIALTFWRIKAPKSQGGPRYWRALVNNLYKVHAGWQKIARHPKLLGQLSFITAVNLALTVGITSLIISSLHFHTSFAAILMFSVLGSLSLFINITPANLGIKEGVYIFAANLLGFSVSQVLSIALIDRAVLFLVLAFSWLGSSGGRRQLAAVSSEPKN